MTLTGMLEHDLPTSVDDILRRPILVVVGVPRCIFVVLRHRISDAVALNGGLYGIGGLLESKFRRVDADDDKALVLRYRKFNDIQFAKLSQPGQKFPKRILLRNSTDSTEWN
jgi:hypothetical protein